MKLKQYIYLAFAMLVILTAGCSEEETTDSPEVENGPKELILYKEDGSLIDCEIYDSISEEKGVIRSSYYTPVAYYNFQKSEISSGHDGEVRNASLLEAAELTAGKFPEKTNEILFFGDDESMIGQEFVLYIRNATDYRGDTDTSKNHLVNLIVKVTGLQNVYPNQIMFSDDFCMQLMQARQSMQVLTLHQFAYSTPGLTHFSGDIYDLKTTGNEYAAYSYFYADDTLEGSEIMYSSDFMELNGCLDYASLDYDNGHTKEVVEKFAEPYKEKGNTYAKQLEDGKISYAEYNELLKQNTRDRERAREQDSIGTYTASVHECSSDTEEWTEYIISRDLTVVDVSSLGDSYTFWISHELYEELFPVHGSNRILLTVESEHLSSLVEKAEKFGLKTYTFSAIKRR